jgi:hypothetical protein
LHDAGWRRAESISPWRSSEVINSTEDNQNTLRQQLPTTSVHSNNNHNQDGQQGITRGRNDQSSDCIEADAAFLEEMREERKGGFGETQKGVSSVV